MSLYHMIKSILITPESSVPTLPPQLTRYALLLLRTSLHQQFRLLAVLQTQILKLINVFRLMGDQ